MADEPDHLFGIPVSIVSDAEAEQATYVVCTTADTPSPFADNLRGVCGLCGVAIQFRPYMPERPMKICLDCYQHTANPS